MSDIKGVFQKPHWYLDYKIQKLFQKGPSYFEQESQQIRSSAKMPAFSAEPPDFTSRFLDFIVQISKGFLKNPFDIWHYISIISIIFEI